MRASWSVVTATVFVLVGCGGSSGNGIPDPAANGATSSSSGGTSSGTSSSSSSSSSSSGGDTDSGASSSSGSSGDGGSAGTFDLRFAYLGAPLALGNSAPVDVCVKAGTRIDGPVMEKAGAAGGINAGQVSARFKAPAGVSFTVFLVPANVNACPAVMPVDATSIEIPAQAVNAKLTLARLPVAGQGSLKLFVDEGAVATANRTNVRLIHGATGVEGTISLSATNSGGPSLPDLFQGVPFGGVMPVTFPGTSANGYRALVPFNNRQAEITRDSDGKAILTGALSLKGLVHSLFTYGHFKNGAGSLQLLGCNDEEQQGGFTVCQSAGWQEVPQ